MEKLLKERVFTPKYAITSIVCTGDPEVIFEDEQRCYILQLEFDDILGPHPSLEVFTPEMAKQAAYYLDKCVRKGVEYFIFHCLAGVSRSAGMAAAMAKHYLGDDREFFSRYTPNMTVYKLTLEALYEVTHGSKPSATYWRPTSD